RGGGRRRRGRAVDGVGADRRPAGQPHSPPGGAAPAGDNRRSARDSRPSIRCGARGRDRAADRRVGAGRTRVGLVVDAVSRRRLAIAQLLSRVGLRFPAGRRHRRARLGRGGGRHADRAVSARGARAISQHDAAGAGTPVSHAPAHRQSARARFRDPDSSGRRHRGRRSVVAPSRSDGAITVGTRSAPAPHTAIGDACAGVDQEAVRVGRGAGARASTGASGRAGAVARRTAATPILTFLRAAYHCGRVRTGAPIAPPAHCAKGGLLVAAQGNMTTKILVVATVLLVHTAAAQAQQSAPVPDGTSAAEFPPAYAPPPGYTPPAGAQQPYYGPGPTYGAPPPAYNAPGYAPPPGRYPPPNYYYRY